MKTEAYISLLLKKYRQAPSFPFNDWKENTVSLYALMNLWDELFKTAAGQLANEYEAVTEVAIRPERHVYDVGLVNRTRRFSITPCDEGGTFLLVGSDATEGFKPELIHLGHLPDRSWLECSTDLDANRLIACFEIIRHYTHSEIETPNDADVLQQAYIKTYRDYFGFPDFDPFEHYDESGRYVEPPDDEEED